MAKSEAYEKLIFELGDKARDDLAERNPPLPAMEKVFTAEEVLLARREELAALEEQLNSADAEHQQLVADQAAERVELQALVKRFRRAVDGIEGKVKELRKKLAAAKAESRINRDALKGAEARQTDLEMSPDSVRVEQGRQLVKRLRVALLRKEREISDLDSELKQALTPEPTLPGAQGIFAHRRLLEMDDQADAQKEEVERLAAEMDRTIAEKEDEIADAEADLNDALFELGTECYTRRIPEEALTGFYAKLDRIK